MKTIVVGVDGSEGSKVALAWALEQASLSGRARVVALKAWQPVVPASSPWWAEYDIPYDLHDGTRAMLEAIVAEVRGNRVDVEIEECVVRGSPVDALMDAARTADVLVVGSRGFGGFKGLLLGSVGHQLVTHASCPTIVVPLPGSREGSGEHDPRQIVVGVDGSRNSVAALEWAGWWAKERDARVCAIYAWRSPPLVVPPAHIGVGWPSDSKPYADAKHELESFVAATDLPDGVSVETRAPEGDPARVLLEEAARAGLVVVGARGRGGFLGLLLGSVATAVVHHCPCPVAIIPCGQDAW